MSKSSKISLNTDETICLPPETFYSCNVEEDFDNETYFVKSKSVKTNDNKKETTKPRVNNSFTSFPFRKDIKEVLDNKVEEFWTNYIQRNKHSVLHVLKYIFEIIITATKIKLIIIHNV